MLSSEASSVQSDAVASPSSLHGIRSDNCSGMTDAEQNILVDRLHYLLRGVARHKRRLLRVSVFTT